MQQPFEVIEVEDAQIPCDGGTLGHPLVYLHIDELHSKSADKPQIQCPYCSRLYVLKKHHAA